MNDTQDLLSFLNEFDVFGSEKSDLNVSACLFPTETTRNYSVLASVIADSDTLIKSADKHEAENAELKAALLSIKVSAAKVNRLYENEQQARKALDYETRQLRERLEVVENEKANNELMMQQAIAQLKSNLVDKTLDTNALYIDITKQYIIQLKALQDYGAIHDMWLRKSREISKRIERNPLLKDLLLKSPVSEVLKVKSTKSTGTNTEKMTKMKSRYTSTDVQESSTKLTSSIGINTIPPSKITRATQYLVLTKTQGTSCAEDEQEEDEVTDEMLSDIFQDTIATLPDLLGELEEFSLPARDACLQIDIHQLEEIERLPETRSMKTQTELQNVTHQIDYKRSLKSPNLVKTESLEEEFFRDSGANRLQFEQAWSLVGRLVMNLISGKGYNKDPPDMNQEVIRYLLQEQLGHGVFGNFSLVNDFKMGVRKKSNSTPSISMEREIEIPTDSSFSCADVLDPPESHNSSKSKPTSRHKTKSIPTKKRRQISTPTPLKKIKLVKPAEAEEESDAEVNLECLRDFYSLPILLDPIEEECGQTSNTRIGQIEEDNLKIETSRLKRPESSEISSLLSKNSRISPPIRLDTEIGERAAQLELSEELSNDTNIPPISCSLPSQVSQEQSRSLTNRIEELKKETNEVNHVPETPSNQMELEEGEILPEITFKCSSLDQIENEGIPAENSSQSASSHVPENHCLNQTDIENERITSESSVDIASDNCVNQIGTEKVIIKTINSVIKKTAEESSQSINSIDSTAPKTLEVSLSKDERERALTSFKRPRAVLGNASSNLEPLSCIEQTNNLNFDSPRSPPHVPESFDWKPLEIPLDAVNSGLNNSTINAMIQNEKFKFSAAPWTNPLNRSDILRFKKAVKDYLSTEWTSESVNVALTSFASILEMAGHRAFCDCLVTSIGDLEDDLLFEPFNSFAPHSPKSHQQIVLLVERLGLGKCICSEIERRIFVLIKDTVSLKVLVNLMYVMISLLDLQINKSYDTSPIRAFMAKSMYYFQRKCIIVIHMLLKAFPFILPQFKIDSSYQDYLHTDPMVDVILCVLMNKISYHEHNADSLLMKDHKSRLLILLQRFYRYKFSQPPVDYTLNLLLDRLHTNRTLNVTHSLLLLAKRFGWSWARDEILTKHIVPLLQRLLEKNQVMRHCYLPEEENKIEICLAVISGIVKTMPKTENLSSYKMLFKKILDENTYTHRIQECAVKSILKMTSFGMVNAYQLVQHWHAQEDLSPQLFAMLKTILSRKPQTFWQALARS